MTRARRSLGAAIGLAAWCAIAATAVSAQQSTRRPAEKPTTPQSLGIHGFSVVLVAGAMQGADSGDTVPPAARKALTDMRDFLPYKRYQLMDAAWMLCCAGFSKGSPSISGRLRGPEQREYTYHIDPIGVSESKINLRFSMREVPGTAHMAIDASKLSDTARLEHGRQLAEAVRERDQAAQLAQRAIKQHEVGVMNTADKEAAELRLHRAMARVRDLEALAQGRAAGSRTGSATIMDSTFAIAPGETVVIGTSRIMGDQALIALLTAATKPGGGAR
jgi:hypothetical protein